MNELYELFEELNEEIKNRDIGSEQFAYTNLGEEDYINYYGDMVIHNSTFPNKDKLQILENIKFNLEDMLFNIQTALYAVEAVRKKI